jgi:fructokinase
MIVCCGEALVDLVRDPDTQDVFARPGGAPANTAVAAARLGAPTAFWGRISHDEHGEVLLAHLRASGVRLELVERGPEPTASAMVEGDPPVFRFSGEDTADTVLGAVDLGLLGLAADEPLLLHSGSLAMFRGSAATSIIQLFEKQAGSALRSFDPNVRPFAIGDADVWRTVFDRWLAAAELLRVSDDDLGWIRSSEEPLAAAEGMLERGPEIAIVSRGARGAAVVSASGTIEVAAPSIQVVDTVGAGDSFTGATLAWLDARGIRDRSGLAALSSDDWETVLGYAARVAAVTCSRPGADPPWAPQLGES